MNMKQVGCGLLTMLVVVVGGGCGKSKPEDASSQSKQQLAYTNYQTPIPPQEPVAVAHLYWLGKQRLSAETNATNFIKLWQEPESAKLEAHILDKLAVALAKDQPTNTQSTGTNSPAPANAAVVQLTPQSQMVRPLLEDLVSAESYLEVRQASGGGEAVLAVHLPDEKDVLWQTNLSAFLQIAYGGTSAASGDNGSQIQLPKTADASTTNSAPAPPLVSIKRVGEWTLLGFSRQTNALVDDMAGRIARHVPPFSGRTTHDWLEFDFNLQRVAKALALDWKLPEDLPAISGAISGDGENAVTRAALDFPKPLPPLLERWNIPTNLVQKQLLGFTAINGIAPLLRTFPIFAALSSNSVPNQLYLWDAQSSAPFGSFFAAPVGDATNLFLHIAPPLMDQINSHVQNAGYGSASVDTNASSLKWTGLPHATPFLDAFTNSFLLGGFGPHLIWRTNTMSPEMANYITQQTNLVCYEWEITGQRLIHWRFLDDVYRMAFDAHGPRLSDTPSLAWFAHNVTNLMHSRTEIRQTGPNQLSIANRSRVGLNALQLNLAANWVELPQFPGGLGTILATNPVPMPKPKWVTNRGTNQPPAEK
jgi:hypothetical protein